MRNLIKKVILEYTEEVKEAQRFKNYDINDESFARLFHYFLTELKENTGFSRARMLHSFDRTIRNWSERPPQIISKSVIDHFITNHPTKNPFKVRFRPRDKFGIPVIFEHTTPVNVFVKSLLQTNTLEEVRQVMNEYSGMSIITVEEDLCLLSKGYSRNRPQGWQQSYNECGIEIMNEAEYEQYKQQVQNNTGNTQSSEPNM
jgi:hypothetical protein